MAPADITALLRTRPFQPFRLVSSDGTIYEIRHPELVVVALASVVVGYPDQRQPGVAERYDIVSLRHIVRLEPSVGAAANEAPQGNGEG